MQSLDFILTYQNFTRTILRKFYIYLIMNILERLNKVLESAFKFRFMHKKKDWANFLRLNYTYFCGVTKGKQPLSASFLMHLQRELNINSDWIMTGNGEMFLNKPTQEPSNVETTEKSESLLEPEQPKSVKNYETVNTVMMALKFTSFKKMALAIGYPNFQLIYDLRTGKAQKIPGDFITKVCAKFPEVNPKFLMYGVGDVIVEESKPKAKMLKEPEEAFSVGRTSNEIVEQWPDDTPMAVKQGKLYSVDMQTLGMVSLRDYYAQNSPADSVQAMPPRTVIYQTHTNLLKKWGILKYDWLTLQLIQDHSKLINGKVYLVVYENGIMVKRLEIEDGRYILSLPVKRPDYPDLKVSATEDMYFYDIVSRITTNIGSMIDDSDDCDYLAHACVEANKHLLINEQKAHDNTAAALKIIDKLTNGKQ